MRSSFVGSTVEGWPPHFIRQTLRLKMRPQRGSEVGKRVAKYPVRIHTPDAGDAVTAKFIITRPDVLQNTTVLP